MVTKNSTTINLTGEEQTVQFDRSYSYFWVQNLGDKDVFISVYSGIVEGADGVITVPAGGSCGTMHGYPADKLYLLGLGKVQVMGTGSAFNPFRNSWKGGVDSSLSKAGYAADSKVVGDKLKLLQDVINGVTHRFVTDAATAYSKDVPVGAKIASVNRVGGMTIKQNDSLISAPVTAFHSTLDGRTLQSKEMPSAVLALEGYGDGINDIVYNYVDFETKTYNRMFGEFIFDGTENWEYVPENHFFRIPDWAKKNNAKSYGASICNVFEIGNMLENVDNAYSISVNFNIKKTSYNTVDSFKSYIAALYAAGNPLVVKFELVKPVVTDISDMFPADFNIMNVMTGGKIEFGNEYKIAVPNEVEYIVDLAEVIAND